MCIFYLKFGFYPDTKKSAENGHENVFNFDNSPHFEDIISKKSL